ncbi:unnamed protein product [Diatraea saccharalis]|uniref:Upstream activation factor subunit spp27 n=1 Tax=Diatraea saccharalis TaxID=40085 RepID=A0A9N9WIR2_9NEOP|nr:unnamed protein product [Diatraea saccharalis]
MPQVTDEELHKEIEKILKKADLSKTSTKKVIQKLEEVFDTDLTSKKESIDKMVLDFVNSQVSDDDEDEDEDEEEEEEEEKKKPPKRAAKTNKRAKKPRKADSRRNYKGSSDEDEDDNDGNDSEFEEKKSKPKAKKGAKGGGRGKGSGYTRAYKLSPSLSALMGADEMPRHEVVKRMWALIKEKQLYDPNNKQFAICDEGLYKVIGTKRFRIFGMMKYLKSHFIDE